MATVGFKGLRMLSAGQVVPTFEDVCNRSTNFTCMRHTFLVVTVKNGQNRCTFTEVIAKLKQEYHFLDHFVF